MHPLEFFILVFGRLFIGFQAEMSLWKPVWQVKCHGVSVSTCLDDIEKILVIVHSKLMIDYRVIFFVTLALVSYGHHDVLEASQAHRYP